MKNFVAGSLFFVFIFWTSYGFTSELMSTADQMESKSWGITAYGRSVKTKPILKLTDASSIQIPTTGGGTTIFSASDSDVKLEEDHQETVAAFTTRPRDGLTYHLKLGQIRDFDMQFASGSVTNSLESLKNGYLWGLGIKWNAALGTIVSSAIAIDLSYTQRQIDLDRFHSNGNTISTDKKFEQDELQGALNVSRRWAQLEPYAGIKVLWVQSTLKDDDTKEKVSGRSDGLSPFVGFEWEFFPKESFIVEASFVDEKSLSAGLNVKF